MKYIYEKAREICLELGYEESAIKEEKIEKLISIVQRLLEEQRNACLEAYISNKGGGDMILINSINSAKIGL